VRRRRRRGPGARIEVEVLLPVVAGGVESVMHALPRRRLGFLEEDAHVAALIGRVRRTAELTGQPGKQLVGTPSRAHHVQDDRGERHLPAQ
jgi:hypothetical protein